MDFRVLMIALAVAFPALAQSKISVSQISDSVYEVRLTSEQELTVDQAQSEIAVAAAQACGNRPVTLGRYSFESSKELGISDSARNASYIFIQKVECVAALEQQPLPTTTPVDPAEKALIESAVRLMTDQYFANLAKEQYSSAFAVLDEEMQAERPWAEWKDAQKSFHALAGGQISGGISRVTVYVDPPSAPKPGIYVATDYEFSYGNLPFQCGYLIWYRHGTEEFRLSREETGFIDEQTAASLSKDQIQDVRRQVGCVDL